MIDDKPSRYRERVTTSAGQHVRWKMTLAIIGPFFGHSEIFAQTVTLTTTPSFIYFFSEETRYVVVSLVVHCIPRSKSCCIYMQHKQRKKSDRVDEQEEPVLDIENPL